VWVGSFPRKTNIKKIDTIPSILDSFFPLKKNKASIVGKVCETRSSKIENGMKKGCDLMANYTSSPRGII
jgi:hypothetical protein